MKKVLFTIAASFAIFALVSCGGSGSSSNEKKDNTETPQQEQGEVPRQGIGDSDLTSGDYYKDAASYYDDFSDDVNADADELTDEQILELLGAEL